MALSVWAALSSLLLNTLKHLLGLSFQQTLSGEEQPGTWVPVDFHFGLYRSYQRVLEMPLLVGHRLGERHYALHLRATLLLHISVIVDFRKVQLNGGKRRALP